MVTSVLALDALALGDDSTTSSSNIAGFPSGGFDDEKTGVCDGCDDEKTGVIDEDATTLVHRMQPK